ncbi:MAG TPA: MBL fold metallo-hydrolase [Ktedonobacteraceae bacterium]|jgi:Cft2 family RNA processing exonuclease
MQVIFVGGAQSIGASCLALELAEQWIVVDAGVQVSRKTDPLPDLALLEGKQVRAIFVTHAHADHIGALPVLHRAFPGAPIFASRATGLLMEVMLADALKIMNRRAVEEMEIPLYPPELVGSMLNQLRPLPTGENLLLPQLPGITIHASRAGHIAGAVSFAFTASEGTIVVSGDISMTPQRTVEGAVAPPVRQCDLLVLESTYGARLHPNRQAEEQRLAQAVAEGIARGGHVLLPCFGLGRGQEILLILRAAQEQGQIPEFPIFVDGLVRRICSTYLLMPEALPAVLQRQIRRGYLPFNGGNISFVRDERQREHILSGPPACVLSSSGMLTGGPSVWYARRLACLETASILITGYQDEEAPGRRLLDLAEQKSSTLELEGAALAVHCHVAKFSLSAHADGGELAAYAAALKPRQVALVHGDEEARLALSHLLTGTEVVLPENGGALTPARSRGKQSVQAGEAQTLAPLPRGIGQGRDLGPADLLELWQVVSTIPALRIVTARLLASLWYGGTGEEYTRRIQAVLGSDTEQRYFIHQQALEEAYRVRGQSEEAPGDFLGDLVGKLLLVEVGPGSSKPVLCLGIEPGARIRVLHPRGIDFVRTRYPFSAIIDLLGEGGDIPGVGPGDGRSGMQETLESLVKAARRVRRRLSAHTLAEQCQENATYTLGDLCQLAGLSASAAVDRLAVAKLLYKNPLIFMQQRPLLEGEGLTLYALAPEWREMLEEPEEQLRPDQQWIQEVIEKHLGGAADLYRRSIDPQSGEITLSFHFPAVARTRYAAQLAALIQEAGVQVTLAARPHQGELIHAAHLLLPSGLQERSFPSLYHEEQRLHVKCVGEASAAAIAAAQQMFVEQTGWQLELDMQPAGPDASRLPVPESMAGHVSMDQHAAISSAQSMLRNLPGYVKVGAEPGRRLLHARFHFPPVARQRFADVFAEIEACTGWQVVVAEGIHQEALSDMARRVLPSGLTPVGMPSLYLQQQAILLQCKGAAAREEVLEAQERFAQETGWQLTITVPGSRDVMDVAPRLAQNEALAQISAALRSAPELARIGVDSRLKIFWLHFHFPEKARTCYGELLTRLEQKTGWRIYLHPQVHQRALVEVAQRLLPTGISLTGQKKLLHEEQTLVLFYHGVLDEEPCQAVQARFTAETGWYLQLDLEEAP